MEILYWKDMYCIMWYETDIIIMNCCDILVFYQVDKSSSTFLIFNHSWSINLVRGVKVSSNFILSDTLHCDYLKVCTFQTIYFWSSRFNYCIIISLTIIVYFVFCKWCFQVTWYNYIFVIISLHTLLRVLVVPIVARNSNLAWNYSGDVWLWGIKCSWWNH